MKLYITDAVNEDDIIGELKARDINIDSSIKALSFSPSRKQSGSLTIYSLDSFYSENESWKELSNESVKMMRELSSTPYIGYLSCGDYDFWNIFELRFLYELFLPFVEKRRQLEKAFSELKPEEVIVKEYFSYGKITADIARKAGLKVMFNKQIARKNLYKQHFQSMLYTAKLLIIAVRGIFHNILQGGKEFQSCILSLDYRYADIIIPIIEELKKREDFSFMIVDRRFSGSSKKLKAYKIPFYDFEGYVNYNVLLNSSRDTLSVINNLRSVDEDKPAIYDGIDLAPLLRTYIYKLIPSIRELAFVYRCALSFFDKTKIRLAMITEDRSPFQRAFIAAARKKNVKTVAMQSTIISAINQGTPLSCDYMFCDGQSAKCIISSQGIPGDRLIITGQPRFDFLSDKKNINGRAQILERYGIDRNKKIVTFFTQHQNVYLRTRDMVRMTEAICESVKNISDAVLVVKIHPIEKSRALYENIILESGLKSYKFIDDTNIWNLLSASDLVITYSSTAGYEAIVMGKDLIQIDFTPSKKEIIDYTLHGAALGVFSKADAFDCVRQALFDENAKNKLADGRQKYIAEHAYKIDAKSAARAADEFCKLLK